MSQTKHGQMPVYIIGEGYLTEDDLDSRKVRVFAAQRGANGTAAAIGASAAVTDTLALDPARAFRFSRMFDLPAFRPAPAALSALAATMVRDGVSVTDHPQLPAGFTYFGQFVDHDITMDKTAGLPDGALEPGEIEQGRSPSLDLDSLYGRGPRLSPALYEADGVKLRVGSTTPTPDADAVFPNDLPRGFDVNNPQLALIGDPRNDENLAVAQTHLAMIKFHNRVVDHLRATTPLTVRALFAEAQNLVIKHYQWLVLKDFVQRIVDVNVFRDVLANGRKFYRTDPSGEPTMPVEFSVAAYRLGHSMIRSDYEWNRVFNSQGPNGIADLGLLFTFTGGGQMFGSPTLPSNWIIDWRRFYDFRSFPGMSTHRQMNHANRLDPILATLLGNLPEGSLPLTEMIRSLAERNLKRGRLLGLPSGQAVAGAIGVTPLTPAQMRSGDPMQAEVLRAHGFDAETPLWFYILKEAQVLNNGRRLGPVGSRIVVETFVGLIEGSRISFLRDNNWRPSLPSLTPGVWTMTNMLKFVDDLNPIGDPA